MHIDAAQADARVSAASTASAAATVTAQGEAVPPEYIAPLRDSSACAGDAQVLRERFHEDGYVYLPGLFDRDDVMAARAAVFGRLAAVGEIAEPPIEGIFTGESHRKQAVADLGEFWRSVSESWALRRLSHGPRLHRVTGHLLGEDSQVQDYVFLRPAGPGRLTHVHCDYPFFTRLTDQVVTAWVALGDVPLRMGPLFIIEGSHRFADIVDSYRGFDVALDKSRKAARPESPLQLARARNTRLLTGDFGAGDVVAFNMFLLHGALDNVSLDNEVRLSCDVRYQLASAPRDPRYFGPDPGGTTGAGYGELVGAKPMTEEWHQR